MGNIEILEGFLTRKLTWICSKLTIHEIIDPLLFSSTFNSATQRYYPLFVS